MKEEKEDKSSAEDTNKPVNTQKTEKVNSNNRIIPKRRGLKIVKKKKPSNEHKIEDEIKSGINEDTSNAKMKSLSEILGGNNEDEKVSTKTTETTAAKAKVKKRRKKFLPKHILMVKNLN